MLRDANPSEVSKLPFLNYLVIHPNLHQYFVELF
uniref:Uncharacterized protein n=1 Tax=Rhizophora mucronata TaxID=61149 RepID=A0A2P2KWG0_RHIMU